MMMPLEERKLECPVQQSMTFDAIDVMKFVGAWMVVVIHTKPFQPYFDVLNVYTAEGICRIAVPFFFAVSGVFLYQKLEQIKDPMQAFRICLRQSGKNLQLYLTWSVVYWLISIVRTGMLSSEWVADQIRLFFCDASVYHFWYLIALIYGIPVMGIIFRWNRKAMICLCAIPWIYRCVWYVYRWIPGGDGIPWTTRYWDSMRNALTCAVPMMIIGILCWQNYEKRTSIQWRKRTMIWLVLNMAELTALYFLSPQKVHFEYLLTIPMLTYCFVNWLLSVKFRFGNRAIPQLLRMGSIWIYCSHVANISIFGWFSSSQGLRRFVVVTGSLAASTAIYLVIKGSLVREKERMKGK